MVFGKKISLQPPVYMKNGIDHILSEAVFRRQ